MLGREILVALLAALAAAALAHSVYAQEPSTCSTGSAFDIEIGGLKDRTGRVIAELYPANQADFLQDRDVLLKEGKVFRRVVAPLDRLGQPRLCISAPGPGAYALIVIHDRDGHDKFSISRDGLALPTNHSLGMSRPTVTEASVTIATAPRVLHVQMQYLRGLRGFAPTGA